MDDRARTGSRAGPSGPRAWAVLTAVLVVLAVVLGVAAARDDDRGGIGGRSVPPVSTTRTRPAPPPQPSGSPPAARAGESANDR